MRNLIVSVMIFVSIFSLQTLAAIVYDIEGRVIRIENGKAIIKTKTGLATVHIFKLTKEDQELVKLSAGQPKDIKLKLVPSTLENNP